MKYVIDRLRPIPSSSPIFLSQIFINYFNISICSLSVLDNLKSSSDWSGSQEFEDDYEKNAALDLSRLDDGIRSPLERNDLLLANAFLLFVAGLDTTSSTMTFVVHNLLNNPEVQDKVIYSIEILSE